MSVYRLNQPPSQSSFFKMPREPRDFLKSGDVILDGDTTYIFVGWKKRTLHSCWLLSSYSSKLIEEAIYDTDNVDPI